MFPITGWSNYWLDIHLFRRLYNRKIPERISFISQWIINFQNYIYLLIYFIWRQSKRLWERGQKEWRQVSEQAIDGQMTLHMPATAWTGQSWSWESAIESGCPMWVAGIQLVSLQLLPPRVHTNRKPELGKGQDSNLAPWNKSDGFPNHLLLNCEVKYPPHVIALKVINNEERDRKSKQLGLRQAKARA